MEEKEHGGETYTYLFERVLSGFDNALKIAREKNVQGIALVSHMWVTKSIVTDLMGLKPEQQVPCPQGIESKLLHSLPHHPIPRGSHNPHDTILTRLNVWQDKWKKVDIPTASISVLDFPRKGAREGAIVSVGVKPELPDEAKENTEGLLGG